MQAIRTARAFVFAAEEDFGIAMVEAQACGTPVIAYGKGGARDILRGPSHPAPTGLFFAEQSAPSIVAAVERFEALSPAIAAADCQRQRAAVQPRALPGRDAPRRRAAPARKAAMLFSLIMATRGRTGEVGEFLDSLLAQGRDDAEAIVVDQNGDDRLAPIIARYAGRLPLPVAPVGSRQRLPCAQPRTVAGARRDRRLPGRRLRSIRRACWRGWRRPSQPIPRSQVLTGPAASPAGGLGSGRWRRDGGPITPANAWTSVIEFNLFLRRDTALALGGFDERLGPGTPFGSAEGNDLVLRAVAAGHKAVYDPELRVVHPDKRMTAAAAERARLYGTGLGFVLRRHRVPPSVWLPFFVRPLGGAVLGAARGDAVAVRHHLGSLRGRWAGFTAPGSAAGVPLAPLADGAALSLRIAIGIATRGRAAVLAETLAEIGRQRRAPDRVIVCHVSAEDVAGVAAGSRRRVPHRPRRPAAAAQRDPRRRAAIATWCSSSTTISCRRRTTSP